jgi:hypothetical protein
MKTIAYLLAYIIACGVLLMPTSMVLAADQPAKLAVAWEMTSDGRDGPMTPTLTISQDGVSLKGTLTRRCGDPPPEGAVTEDKLNFTVKRHTPDGDTSVIEYLGTAEGDSVKGPLQSGLFDWGHETEGSCVQPATPFYVPLSAVGQLPALSFAPSEGVGVFTSAKALYSSSTEYSGSAEPPPVPAPPAGNGPRGIGAGVRVSSLGIGGEAAVKLTGSSNLRGGFNLFGYSRGFSKDGISYAASLSWRSAEAHYDWFPFGGGLHLSPGLLAYNGNTISANASVPGGHTLTLNGVHYLSDPASPVSGSGKIDFNKAGPSVMLGWGNLVRRRGKGFVVNFEVGIAYQAAPKATLNLGGGVCSSNGSNCRSIASDATVQANVAAEQTKINHDISAFKVYPLISLGLGYRFR